MRAEQAVKAAEKRGYEAGTSAGGWVLDGNSKEADARWVMEGYDNGDPEVMDLQPAPLSGEWGGESINELLGDLTEGRRDNTKQNIMDAYEEGFQRGFWDEVTRAAAHMLTPA